MSSNPSRRDFIRTAAVGAAGMAMPSRLLPQAETRRPNVLFISVDDMNYWTNCLGNYRGKIHTPNLDRLAAKGVLFANAHCAAPSCNPSRTSLMTGIRPSTSGVYNNTHNWRDSPVLKNAVTIPAHFRDNGYDTRGGGKIFHALSWVRTSYGLDQNDFGAWDEYFPSKTRSMPETWWPKGAVEDAVGTVTWNPVYTGNAGARPPYYFDWQAIPDADESRLGDHKVVDWAIGELKKQHDKPFFLGVGLYKPHIPWFVPKKYFDLYPLDEIVPPDCKLDWEVSTPKAGLRLVRRDWHKWLIENDSWRRAIQGYLACFSHTDAQIGRLLDTFDASPYRDNTVIVLWSDHGFHLGTRDHWEKFTLWEPSTHVNLMMTAPGVTTPGTRCEQPVSLIDIYPTLNELCGLPRISALEGTSLVPQLKDVQTARSEPVVTTWGHSHAVRDMRWRYIHYGRGFVTAGGLDASDNSVPAAYRHLGPNPGEELYDRENDPGEWNNLAGNPEYAGQKAEMLDWLHKLITVER